MVGTAETGTDVLLVCQIKIVPRLVATPAVYWMKRHHIDVINITILSNTTTNENIMYSTLTLTNLKTSDAGIYFCETKISMHVFCKDVFAKKDVTLFIQSK